MLGLPQVAPFHPIDHHRSLIFCHNLVYPLCLDKPKYLTSRISGDGNGDLQSADFPFVGKQQLEQIQHYDKLGID
jgi:hypothetical protein